MEKEITLEERKTIQLKMLHEIHDFCCSHRIRYSLAYGTLIGAIRHNGYIPWDDDVDIMMPITDMLLFKKIFRSDNLKFCDVDTEENYEYAFPRIAFSKTYNKEGLSAVSYGINIDLYPVISIPEGNEFDAFYSKGKRLFDYRMFVMRLRHKIISRFPVSSILFHKMIQKKYRDFLYHKSPKYGSTNSYYVIGGPFNLSEIKKCTYHYDIFSTVVMHDFESVNLYITSHYHDFLTHYYGDYMQFPPENERHPYHGGHYYWY